MKILLTIWLLMLAAPANEIEERALRLRKIREAALQDINRQVNAHHFAALEKIKADAASDAEKAFIDDEVFRFSRMGDYDAGVGVAVKLMEHGVVSEIGGGRTGRWRISGGRLYADLGESWRCELDPRTMKGFSIVKGKKAPCDFVLRK